MIKRYYFKNQPSANYDTLEIIKGFNPLYAEGKQPDKIEKNGFISQRREFFGSKFYITTISSTDEKQIEGITKIYQSIEKAAPELLKVVIYSEQTILIARANLKRYDDNTNLTNLIDELSRISALLIHALGFDGTVEFISRYVKTNVSTPALRLLSNLGLDDKDITNNDKDE